MSASWSINGQSPESLGVEVIPPSLQLWGPSSMALRLVRAFDAAEVLSYGDPVTLTKSGVTIFAGKVTSVPKGGSAEREGHTIIVEDAWAELEKTTYQEDWSIGSTGTVWLPRAILGLAPNGTARSTTQQVAAAINYAASMDVDIQAGSISGGIPLWHSEAENMTVAEVIRQSLRLTPHLIPWIDYTTSPPSFNVTPQGSLAARHFPVDGSGNVTNFEVVKRDDLHPEAVRIVFTTATNVDGEVYRSAAVDKYPTGGPNGGPRVLGATIELAGGQMQFQKQRIKVEALPTDQEAAKAWLKKHIPALKDVPNGHFNVTKWDRALADDGGTNPNPINPLAQKPSVANVGQLPNVLLNGSIEDWMQVRVGVVHVDFAVEPTSSATDATRKAIQAAPRGWKGTCTNATTGRYKGVTQWINASAAPQGLAEAVYNSINGAWKYEGRVTVKALDFPTERLIATRLNLIGGLGAWTTMDALVHGVDYDVERGEATLTFGPSPDLGPADFLELQKVLQNRRPRWMSGIERTSNKLGAEAAAGSRGDTVGGFDMPGGGFIGGGGGDGEGGGPLHATLRNDGTSGSPSWKVVVSPGMVNGKEAAEKVLNYPGGKQYLHFKGKLTPTVAHLGGGYATVGSGGAVSNVEFVLNSNENVDEDFPSLDGSDVTAGNFDAIWAIVEMDGSTPKFSVPSGMGHARVVFMPPDLYVIFRS